MTRKWGLTILVAVALSAEASGTALGEVRRERLARRPYITEVGQPYALSAGALDEEIARISDMRTYIGRYGYPDYAEIQEIVPDWPWKPYEVRLYYLDRNVEAVFGAVNLSPAAPNFGVMKSHNDMTLQKRHEIELVLQSGMRPAAQPPAAASASADRLEVLVSRVEAAAERAVRAADRAVMDSEAAARAADRTVATVQKMERRGHRAR
jgi:hypothetical protein